MSGLNAFLSQNAIKVDNIKHPVSPRFIENGKPIEWEICAITSEEDETIRRTCTKRVPIPGRKNQFTQETDINLYLGKLAARCTVFPNLNDKELQDSYGVMGSDSLLKTMLTAGEYAGYLKNVQEVNGFETPMDDLAEEAKN